MRKLKVGLIGALIALLVFVAAAWSLSLHGQVHGRDIPYSPSPVSGQVRDRPPPRFRLHGVKRSRKLRTRARQMMVAGARVPVTYMAHQVMWVGYGSGPFARTALVKKWQNCYWDFRYEGHFAHAPYCTVGWWVNESDGSALFGWRHTQDQAPSVYGGVYWPNACPYESLYPDRCLPWHQQDSASSFELCIFRIGCINSATIWTSQRVAPRRWDTGLDYSENAWRS